MFLESQMMTEIPSSAMENELLRVIVYHKHHIWLFLTTHPKTIHTYVLLQQVVAGRPDGDSHSRHLNWRLILHTAATLPWCRAAALGGGFRLSDMIFKKEKKNMVLHFSVSVRCSSLVWSTTRLPTSLWHGHCVDDTMFGILRCVRIGVIPHSDTRWRQVTVIGTIPTWCSGRRSNMSLF